jgi:hypothetical protein
VRMPALLCTYIAVNGALFPTYCAAVADVATDDKALGTGIQELESSVFGFLYSHAGVLKLLAIVDDLTRMLSQVGP